MGEPLAFGTMTRREVGASVRTMSLKSESSVSIRSKMYSMLRGFVDLAVVAGGGRKLPGRRRRQRRVEPPLPRGLVAKQHHLGDGVGEAPPVIWSTACQWHPLPDELR